MSQSVSKLCGGTGSRASIEQTHALSPRERNRTFGAPNTQEILLGRQPSGTEPTPGSPGQSSPKSRVKESKAKTALDTMPRSRVENLRDMSRESNLGNIQ